jgi:hypothetical protein
VEALATLRTGPAHWYNPETFERLIAAYVRDNQDNYRTMTVREFVALFKGLSGSAKQKAVLEAVGAARMTLAEFLGTGAAIHKDDVTGLLYAMKAESRPVKPIDLGFIGEEHLRVRLTALGVHENSFRYKRIAVDDDEQPFVIEAAFGYRPKSDQRYLAVGLNFSPAIGNPIRPLNEMLSDAWADSESPVMLVLHITCPRFAFTDRGKGSIALSDEMYSEIADAIRLVTKEWTKQSKAEHRSAEAQQRRAENLTVIKKASMKDAAFEIMEKAYQKASAGLSATATQIMYAARTYIQDQTDKTLNRQYFNGTLLPQYMAENPETTANWDVTYDDRGHFVDPHTGETIGLGTVSVRGYLHDVSAPEFRQPKLESACIITRGPHCGFGGLFYIEKEGFLDIMARVQLAQRLDLGIMSCKGNSVVAARRFADELCHKYKIPLFVLHDFDKSGLTILNSLRSNSRRYNFRNNIDVFDLGLRLEDVERLGLMGLTEKVSDKGSREKRAQNMRNNGATEAEIDFLLDKRVELNALDSGQFVSFVEEKLIECGARKVVPDQDQIEKAYKLFVRGRHEEILIQRERAKIDQIKIELPGNLMEQVNHYLKQHPHVRWDDAVASIAMRPGQEVSIS